MVTELIFRVEDYIDPVSKNRCEIFSVYFTEETDGIRIKRKIWERDYGSQTEAIDDYISDYLNYRETKEEIVKPQDKGEGWVATSTY
jgi:uridine kinase